MQPIKFTKHVQLLVYSHASQQVSCDSTPESHSLPADMYVHVDAGQVDDVSNTPISSTVTKIGVKSRKQLLITVVIDTVTNVRRLHRCVGRTALLPEEWQLSVALHGA